MAFDFPAAPAVGQVYNGYRFNGVAWDAIDSGGGAQVITDDTPPSNPADGDLWWESDTGKFYISYDDGNSVQWVQPIGGSTTDTPAQILAKLITVDGAGSGLDADLLDGMSASFFQPALGYTPLNKAGDSLGGTLTFGTSTLNTSGSISLLGGASLSISGTANYISLVDTDEGKTRHIHHNTGMIGFLGSTGAWIFRAEDTGAVWTSQLGDLNARIEARGQAWGQWGVNQCVTSSRMAGYAAVDMPQAGNALDNSAYVITMLQKMNSDSYRAGSRQPQLHIPNVGWFAAFPW